MSRLLLIALALALVPDPALAGPVAAVVGAVFGAVKAFAASSLLAGFLVRAAISVGFSMLQRALMPKKRPRAPGLRTEVTQSGGTNPQTFCLGRTATAGQLIAPPMSAGTAGKTPNAYLYYAVAAGCLPGHSLERVIIDDAYVPLGATPDPSWGRPAEGRLAGVAWVDWRDGSQTAAHAGLRATFGADPDRPWLADMVAPGVCYAVLRFKFDRERFNGLPAVRLQVLGIPLYDPRADSTVGGSGAQRWADPATWTQSTNPAVMIYNILRGIALPDGDMWGAGVAAADLPLANWFAAMNECDVAIADGDGGSNPQYAAGMEVGLDDEPAEVIDELLKACSGQIVEIGGIWKIRVGGPGLPVASFADADIALRDAQLLTPFPGLDTTINAVSAAYPDPGALWNLTDAPPRLDPALEAADGGRRLSADLRLPAASAGEQVQRLMTAWLAEERRFRRHQLALPPDYLQLEPLDAVSWTSARNGYDSKLFEVTETADSPMTLITGIGLRERDPDDYDWAPTATQGVPGWAASGVAIKDASSNDRRSAISCTWDADAADDARGLRIAVKLNGAAGDGTEVTVADVRAGAFVIADVLSDTAYQVRARLVVDRPTEWSAWKSATTPDLRIATVDIAPAALNTIIDDAVEQAEIALAVDYLAAQTAVTDALAAAKAAVIADGNPGFELGYDGWRSTYTVVESDLNETKGTITEGRFQSAAGLSVVANQCRFRQLVPGRKYRIRTRLKVSGASATIYVGYQAADADGTPVGSASGGAYPVVNGVTYPVSASDLLPGLSSFRSQLCSGFGPSLTG